ncbi:MAG TPA: TonB-dependent receptor, partial [Solimonas sp.]|nr:TonB-dependent receptor [Solimonas sp.]
MTVTAQRREESIQEVPTMVAAFGAEELRLRGVNDPTSLQFLVPGMVYTSIGKYSFPYIRGIGSNSILPSVDSPVATLLDGVYSATTLIAFKNFADVERVEVLKGPQGTLFGRNSNAGVISVTTREPGDHLEAQAALTLGSQERLGGSVYVAGPLGKLASVGVAGYMERYGPYYENINPDGPTPVDSRNWGLRVKARVPLGEHWSLLAHAYAAEEDGADTAIWENIRPSLDTLALGAQTIDQPRRTNVNREGRSTPRHFGGDLRLNWELPDLELWSLTAYQQTGYSGGVDLDGSNADYAAVYLRDGHANRAWSQELQVASVGEERMDWLAGVYYFDSFGGWDPIFMELGPQTTLGTLLLQPLREALRRAGLDPSSLPADAPPATRVQVRGIIDNHAYAAFGELGWRLTEHWKLIAGLRYSYEERVLVRGSSEIQVLGSIPSTPVSIADFRNMPADWDDWSPKLSLQWRDDAWLAWLTYAEGFKSGTWNAFPLLDPVSLVQPEQIDSWEIGFKSDLWNRRLRLNAAAYHYDYRNLQVFVTSIKSNGTVKIENAGRARVQGVEAELQLRPTAPWLWTLGAAYLDGKYREFIGTGYNQLGEPYQGN